MSTAETITMPALGAEGERCVECETPLAADQRYCLGCGRRRAGARLPFREMLAEDHAAPVAAEAAPVVTTPFTRRPLTLALAGAGLLLLAVGLGALLGHSGSRPAPALAAAPAPVVKVTVPPSQPAATGAQTDTSSNAGQASFNDDWPSGKKGWTVQLKTLTKDGTDVAAVNAAKSAATSKGAPSVGALDSDNYSSLDGGNYVVYSGVFAKKDQAAKALKGLSKKFPGAKVVQVDDGGSGGGGGALPPANKKSAKVTNQQLKNLHNLSPEQYQKRSSKLPDKIQLPGKPPKVDHKKPGGKSGGGGDTIG